MRVNYIFETKKVLFSCSDLDGSIQVKLLDQTGKPVLNSKSKPILIDIEGKPINLEDDNNNGNIPNLNSLINPDVLYPNQQKWFKQKKFRLFIQSGASMW